MKKNERNKKRDMKIALKIWNPNYYKKVFDKYKELKSIPILH